MTTFSVTKAGSKSATIHKIQVLPSGNEVHTTTQVDDVQEWRKQEAEKAATNRKVVMDIIEQAVADNEGSDILHDKYTTAEVDDPGEQEVKDSVHTLQGDWRQFDLTSVVTYLPTSKPPSDVTANELKALQEMAEYNPRLVPVAWLEKQMRQLPIKKEFAERLGFTYGRMAFGSSVALMWMKCVSTRNGFLKTIAEAQLYADRYE